MRRSTRKSSVGVSTEADDRNPAGSFSTRFSLSSFVKRAEKLTDEQRNAVKKVGFGNLLLIPNQSLTKNLLVELMDSWSCEQRAFMLVPGMISMTLLDVALILGLRVIGEPVFIKEDQPFSDMEREYGATPTKRKIAVASLESRLESLGDEVSEDFVRTFTLFVMGTLLFPNTNGKVDSRYLSFLENLDDVGRFSWGAAVLEDLFEWLNRRKETNVQYIGGCLIFLQIWSYEHIDLARPGLVDSHLAFPRACRWENIRAHQRQWFTAKFKELQEQQITWELQPTSEELSFGIIKELSEAQYERKESSSIECSSNSDSVTEVVVLETESNVNNSDDVQVQIGADVNVEQPPASQHMPDIQREVTECPSTPSVSEIHKAHTEPSSEDQHSSEASSSGNGDDLSRRIHLLEAQNMDLKKEVETLRVENELLRNQLLSSDNLVARLEAIVMDEI